MYRIGEFSKLTKTTIKTLRYYDEIGLFKPLYVDQETGYRFYENQQLVFLHRIISFRQLGLKIEEIIAIMNGNKMEIILNQRRKELKSEQEIISDQLSRIEMILLNEEDFLMKYQAIIKDLPECIVYSKRTVIPNYNAYFEVIPKIGKEITKANPTLKCRVPEYCFVIYHDGEYKETNIDIEYCEAVETMGNPVGDITFKSMESISAVCVMHKGPYSKLREAYAYVMKWIEENNYEIIDHSRECYIDGIWNQDKEENWLTEIQLPVKRK